MHDFKFLLGNYNCIFKKIDLVEENILSKTYKVYDIPNEREIYLKIIVKNYLKKGNYDYLLDRINKEEEITNLCSSDNILKIYKRLETKESIIFVSEIFDMNLMDYIEKNGPLKNNFQFFLDIVIALIKVIKILKQKEVIYRNIKPSNIYIKKQIMIILQ